MAISGGYLHDLMIVQTDYCAVWPNRMSGLTIKVSILCGRHVSRKENGCGYLVDGFQLHISKQLWIPGCQMLPPVRLSDIVSHTVNVDIFALLNFRTSSPN